MAAHDDWYRSPGWSQKDQDNFFDHMSRARGNDSKSQYAKIKALSLIESNYKQRVVAAIELLNRSLQEWPSQFQAEKEAHYDALAEAHRRLGNFDDAAAYYEKTI